MRAKEDVMNKEMEEEDLVVNEVLKKVYETDKV